eukprot:GGOE01043014.1.p2 GENE.GGOE01043014.1~~GGOE01043014.1.p2  ORF type:complete len:236 (+),score=85.62 GGOE01043014.1:155-862(+)
MPRSSSSSSQSTPPTSPRPTAPPFDAVRASGMAAVKSTAAVLRLRRFEARDLVALQRRVEELQALRRQDACTLQSLQEQVTFLAVELEAAQAELDQWRDQRPPSPPAPVLPAEEPDVELPPPPPPQEQPTRPLLAKSEPAKAAPPKKTQVERMVEDLTKDLAHLPTNFRRLEGDRFHFGTKKLLLTVVGADVMVSVGGGFWKFVDYVERFGEDEEKKWQSLTAAHRPKLHPPVDG